MPITDWFRRPAAEPDLMARTLDGLTPADLAALETDAHRQERDRHLHALEGLNRQLAEAGLPPRGVGLDGGHREAAEARYDAVLDLHDHADQRRSAVEQADIDTRSRAMTREQVGDVVHRIAALDSAGAPEEHVDYPSWDYRNAAMRAAAREGWDLSDLTREGAQRAREREYGPAQWARETDARMEASQQQMAGHQTLPFPRTPADVDLDQLSALTERDGFAVYDRAAPGGFRELTDAERAVITPTPDEPPASEHSRLSDAEYEAVMADAAASYRRDHFSPADVEAARVDEVRERTDDPTFAYNPRAEWGDPTFREPRSDDEAAARVAHLDAQRETAGPTGPIPAREDTEVEAALVDAQIDEHYSALAHDGDPAPARRVQELEALHELRPVPEVQAEHDAELDEQDHDQPDPGIDVLEPELEDEEPEP